MAGNYFEAEIVSITDYYPRLNDSVGQAFGSVMQTRSYSARAASTDGYRYGFNGKEKESDGSSDNYDFGARICDGRLGRWLLIDPERAKYPGLTTCSFCASSPVSTIDPTGGIIEIAYSATNKKGEAIVKSVAYVNGKYYENNKNGKAKQVKGKALKKLMKNDFVSCVANDLESLRSLGGVAKERLEILEGSEHVHTIQKTNDQYKINESVEKDKTAGDANNGTGTDIYYDQKDESAGHEPEKRPGFIALGHELLGHSFQSDRGVTQLEIMNSSGSTEEHKNDACSVAASEVAALALDNDLRSLFNAKVSDENVRLKLRDSYRQCSVTPEMLQYAKNTEIELLKKKTK